MRVRSRSYCLTFSAGASTFRKTSATGRSGNDCSPNCKGGLVGHSHDFMGEQEGHAIEAVTSLLNAIDDDSGCGEALKPQIRRLRLPYLFRRALPIRFWSASSHPARRALDQLARLQTLLGRTEGKAREEREAGIERVITRVAQNFGNNKEVFADASRELDELLATAEREYAENVATVIKECEQQQTLLRSQRIETGQGSAPSAAPEDPENLPRGDRRLAGLAQPRQTPPTRRRPAHYPRLGRTGAAGPGLGRGTVRSLCVCRFNWSQGCFAGFAGPG